MANPSAGFAARAGLDIARAGAQSWAPDAVLVYIENDEPLDAAGEAGRWGYLFFSKSLEKSRAYSVRGGKILVAETLAMKFDPPPVFPHWIDSDLALESAEESIGKSFREQGGQLTKMLLMRGAFHDGDPNETTWTLVYTAPHGPSLFVMVGASDGKVRRTWRG